MSLNNIHIFVSGGAGVIGSELCPMLLSLGAIVMTGDLKPRPARWNSSIIFRQGDLNMMTKSEVESFQPEIFIHLASTFERSDESYGFWEENFKHNVRLSHHLSGIMKELPSLRRVIFASSYLVYDPNLYNFRTARSEPYSLKETDNVYPRNLTGMAKLAHEIEIRFLEGFKKDSISFVCVRIFRGYGKGSRCIISRWIRSLLAGEEISVYRKENIFDFIYADETANGLIELAEHTELKGIINLGSGKAHRISDILDILKKFFPSMKYNEVDNDIPYEASRADMSLFEKNTGWIPSCSIEDSIHEIIEYEKENEIPEQKPFNLLVTSISRKIPMLKAVRNGCEKFGTGIKIFGGDMDQNCIGRYFTDFFWPMAVTHDLSAGIIIDYCLKHNIKAVIPSRDGELQFYASIKDKLYENGIAVMVSSLEGISNCIDKLLFSKILTENGLPVITSFTSLSEIDSANVVVKERYGSGSLKNAIKVPKDAADKYAEGLESPIFQPFIAGKEYSVDVYVDKKGKAKGAVARSRDIVVNGESQITTTVSTSELELLCCNVAEILKLYGHIIIQVIEDEKGNFHIVECNSRFGGASTLSVAAGLDSFYWFLLEAANVDISEYTFIRSKNEKKQIRFPEDLVIDDYTE